ncbi:MAG: DUF393 domain-containing protein [Nitrosopumilaceae archaeon]|nr:DUF393 domain-containing protein [Nitrosopumilaceae archaeon]
MCNFCSNSVRFIIDRDPLAKFRFAPLQSETAKNLINKFNLENENLDSMILFDDNAYYIKSTAVLKITRGLNSLWPLFYVFIIIPSSLRDYFYDIVARNRYKWFGRKEECMVPDTEINKRFLT